jgi:hypothetical protein
VARHGLAAALGCARGGRKGVSPSVGWLGRAGCTCQLADWPKGVSHCIFPFNEVSFVLLGSM